MSTTGLKIMRLTREEKETILNMYLQGYRVMRIAEHIGCCNATIYHLMRTHVGERPKRPNDRDRKHLERVRTYLECKLDGTYCK